MRLLFLLILIFSCSTEKSSSSRDNESNAVQAAKPDSGIAYSLLGNENVMRMRMDAMNWKCEDALGKCYYIGPQVNGFAINVTQLVCAQIASCVMTTSFATGQCVGNMVATPPPNCGIAPTNNPPLPTQTQPNPIAVGGGDGNSPTQTTTDHTVARRSDDRTDRGMDKDKDKKGHQENPPKQCAIQVAFQIPIPANTFSPTGKVIVTLSPPQTTPLPNCSVSHNACPRSVQNWDPIAPMSGGSVGSVFAGAAGVPVMAAAASGNSNAIAVDLPAVAMAKAAYGGCDPDTMDCSVSGGKPAQPPQMSANTGTVSNNRVSMDLCDWEPMNCPSRLGMEIFDGPMPWNPAPMPPEVSGGNCIEKTTYNCEGKDYSEEEYHKKYDHLRAPQYTYSFPTSAASSLTVTDNHFAVGDTYNLSISGLSSDNCNSASGNVSGIIQGATMQIASIQFIQTEMACVTDIEVSGGGVGTMPTTLLTPISTSTAVGDTTANDGTNSDVTTVATYQVTDPMCEAYMYCKMIKRPMGVSWTVPMESQSCLQYGRIGIPSWTCDPCADPNDELCVRFPIASTCQRLDVVTKLNAPSCLQWDIPAPSAVAAMELTLTVPAEALAVPPPTGMCAIEACATPTPQIVVQITHPVNGLQRLDEVNLRSFTPSNMVKVRDLAQGDIFHINVTLTNGASQHVYKATSKQITLSASSMNLTSSILSWSVCDISGNNCTPMN